MPRAKKRPPLKPRCSFIEEDDSRCRYAGEGNPPLCAYHLDQLYEEEGEAFDEDDPTTAVIGGVVSWLRGKRGNEVVSGFRDILGGYLEQQVAQQYAKQPAPTGHAPPPQYAPPPPYEPPPPEPASDGPDPLEVLGFPPNAKLTKKMIKERQRALAGIYHPDIQGGSVEAMMRVNNAVDELLSRIK